MFSADLTSDRVTLPNNVLPTLLDDLTGLLRKRQILIVIGTGVSLSSTGGNSNASWTGLIESGIIRCQQVIPALSENWANDRLAQVRSGSMQRLLAAAKHVSDKLRAPSGGEFRRWLRETVGSLPLVNTAIIEAIQKSGCIIATTNYDSLLTQVTGRPPVTWREPTRVERVLRRDEEGILHLHGHWTDPESIVLDNRSYQCIKRDKHAMAVLQAIRTTCSMLYIGCGDGLLDPNIGDLLKWSGVVFSAAEYRHYVLARTSELAKIQLHHPQDQRLFAIGYGDDFNDLAPFLRNLFNDQKSLDDLPGISNLPRELSSFVGRDHDIAELDQLIGKYPLLTLVGPGGSGKTRIATRVAARSAKNYANGVCWVDFKSVSVASQIERELLTVLSQAEKPNKTQLEAVIDCLSHKRLLLVFDNCEHLISSIAVITRQILKSCRAIDILATSREGLMLEFEKTYFVGPMSLPKRTDMSVESILSSDAVRLFVELSGLGFNLNAMMLSEIAEICIELDGLPLAIEIVAPRARTMDIGLMRKRLQHVVSMSSSTNQDQATLDSTLDATIKWSVRLLSRNERELFRRLTIFTGTWSIDAAEYICSGTRIDSTEILKIHVALVEKHLVTYNELYTGRYGLSNMIRHYLCRHPPKVQRSTLEDRNLDFMIYVAGKAEAKLRDVVQPNILDEIGIEYTNIRTALDWSLSNSNATKRGLILAGLLGPFWKTRGYFHEADSYLRKLLLQSRDNAESLIRSRALNTLADVKMRLRDFGGAMSNVQEAIKLSEDHADPLTLGQSLDILGTIHYCCGQYDASLQKLNHALNVLRTQQYTRPIATALFHLGGLAFVRQDYSAAHQYEEESLTISRKSQDQLSICISLDHLGILNYMQGNYDLACSSLRESISISRELENKATLPYSIESLGMLSSKYGDIATAVKLYGAANAVRQSTGENILVPIYLRMFDEAVEESRIALGQSKFDELWQVGLGMDFKETIQYALAQSFTNTPAQKLVNSYSATSGAS